MKHICSLCEKELDPISAAKAELAAERFEAEVAKAKAKMLEKKSLWDFLPFTIKIERKVK